MGTLAVITGRPAADAVALGGLETVPGLVVLGHYGWQRWQDGELTRAPAPPAVERRPAPRCPACSAPRAPPTAPGSRTRRTRWRCTPAAPLTRRRRWTGCASRSASSPPGSGLAAEPGRFVIELRPPGVDKGSALTGLVRERAARSVLYCGDDLGDLPAFAAVRSLRADGVPGCAVASASAESPQVAAAADLVVAGPEGVVALLTALAGQLTR